MKGLIHQCGELRLQYFHESLRDLLYLLDNPNVHDTQGYTVTMQIFANSFWPRENYVSCLRWSRIKMQVSINDFFELLIKHRFLFGLDLFLVQQKNDSAPSLLFQKGYQAEYVCNLQTASCSFEVVDANHLLAYKIKKYALRQTDIILDERNLSEM